MFFRQLFMQATTFFVISILSQAIAAEVLNTALANHGGSANSVLPFLMQEFSIGSFTHLIVDSVMASGGNPQPKHRIKHKKSLDEEIQIKKTALIVLYHGSQGSTWFMEALSEYTGVCILGNELIDRIVDDSKRFDFIEQAAQAPRDSDAFKIWKRSMFAHTTETPSKFDVRLFDKCDGTESVFGFKARLNFGEMKFIFAPEMQAKYNIKIIILSRNPVKQVRLSVTFDLLS